MGLVVILFAPHSRTPKTLRALGAVMCMQALAATLLGPDRARAILEWETMHTARLRAGAVVAVATGGLVAFAITTGRRPPDSMFGDQIAPCARRRLSRQRPRPYTRLPGGLEL